jgi:uncharacterized protein (DUF1501 family)
MPETAQPPAPALAPAAGAPLAVGTDAQERTLVVVFLRGGADGLSLVPPVGDDAYHRARPRLALPAGQALDLDGFFAFHPALHELHPFYQEGALAVVHAAGSEVDTHSHFEAQDLVEHGGEDVAGGWLGRFLRSRLDDDPRVGAALSAVALSDELPESLRASPTATALRALDDLDHGSEAEALARQLRTLYAGDEQLAAPAEAAFNAIARMSELRGSDYRPAADAHYATGKDGELALGFSANLARVAQLIKGGVGLVAATVDLHGWDSHFVQDQVLEPRLRALSLGLSAFATDLGRRLATTTVVVMSEFGRRVHENASLGTDHGRGGVMLVLGGGTRGGLHCRWPGLSDDFLDYPGDLPVVHNYRDVLAPVLARHGAGGLPAVFPRHQFQPLAL